MKQNETKRNKTKQKGGRIEFNAGVYNLESPIARNLSQREGIAASTIAIHEMDSTDYVLVHYDL
jgi:hypothetical protein